MYFIPLQVILEILLPLQNGAADRKEIIYWKRDFGFFLMNCLRFPVCVPPKHATILYVFDSYVIYNGDSSIFFQILVLRGWLHFVKQKSQPMTFGSVDVRKRVGTKRWRVWCECCHDSHLVASSGHAIWTTNGVARWSHSRHMTVSKLERAAVSPAVSILTGTLFQRLLMCGGI